MVRTTEDMLNLVPNTLREAASALGMPRSLVIRHVAYRAGMSGLITGVLLAIARMTGETAPLIFTALGNSLFAADPRGPTSALPLIIYEFARKPLRRTTKARVDRRTYPHVCGVGVEHIGAGFLCVGEAEVASERLRDE